MKKIILALLFFSCFICGCSKVTEKDLINKISEKAKNSYKISGDLSISNADNVYHYYIDVSYKAKNYYKVLLTNKNNEHTQVILKNDDGVYVLTPALNKCFKFQSDWPYDNSQIYLISSLINDINKDKNKTFKEIENGYQFTTKVNYPNNKSLKKQKILIDKDFYIKDVKVYDNDDTVKIEFAINNLDFSPIFKNDYFELDAIMKTFNNIPTNSISKLEDSIFPLFLPIGTKMVSNEKVKKENGERIIMTFDGNSPFLLVEETANSMGEFTIIPTYGEPYFLQDTLGVMTDNSITWTSNGIEYYIVSDVMNKGEMIEVARSISLIPTMK